MASPLTLPALEAAAPGLDPALHTVLAAIADAVHQVGELLMTGDAHAKAGTENSFGDDQLGLDVASNNIVFDVLKASGVVSIGSSEETPEEVDLGGEGFSVSFDPLDGSSIIDANFAVGSIFGIWPGRGLVGKTGRQQAASVISVYGPRTTLVIALPPQGDKPGQAINLTHLHEKWELTQAHMQIQPEGKIFAPGNLRATADNEKYRNLVNYWIENKYTLRYSGGLVPDVYHILIKGKGIVTNVISPKTKAKLRLLYECAPIALVVEAAGGTALVAPDAEHPSPVPLLDLPITKLEYKCGVGYGSKAEMEIFQSYLF